MAIPRTQFNGPCAFGTCLHVTISLDQFLNDLGLGSHSYSISSILSHLGINTNAGITLGDVLGALGVSDTSSITPPAITIGDVLSTLGLSDSSSITPPAINVGDVLSTLGLSDSSSLGLSQILSALGLSNSSSINVGDVLSALGLSDSSSLGLSQILSDLGLSSSSSIDIANVLSALGLSDSSGIDIGNVLSALGLSDTSTIPLPSLSIDNILSALGINPNADIFSLFGITNPLTLSPTLDLTGGSVQAFDLALSQDLLAALGNFAQLAQDLPSLLTNNPTLDLVPILSNLLSDLGLPATITGGTLTADLTNIVAELLPGLVP